MGVFEMVVLIVIISTVGKVAQTALARPGSRHPDAVLNRLQAVEAELRESELRLGQAERDVAELTEKLEFVENLLAGPRQEGRLPAPAGEEPQRQDGR